jgi:hypothetical protein
MLVAIFICLLCILLLLIASLLPNILNKPQKSKLDELTFEELFEIINIIINNEISLYERNIFDNGGKIIDKASYDNYYKDIFRNVLESLSDDLVNHVTVYLNKDSFYSMISREIMVYLNSKVL